jgi:hypothetical protein
MKDTKQEKHVLLANPYDEPMVISNQLVDSLRKEEKHEDLLALYTFYYGMAKKQQTTQIWATTSFAAKGMKWTEERVRKTKKKLKELGLIEDLQGKKEDGSFGKRYIRVFYRIDTQRTSDSPYYGENRTTAEHELKCLNTENKINAFKIKRRNASSSFSNGFITQEMFEDFWKLYPRKGPKGKAKKKWIELCTQKTKESIRPKWTEIKDAIKAQIKSEQWQDEQYIPLAATWLHQTRWIDDPNELVSYSKRDERKEKSFVSSYDEDIEIPEKFRKIHEYNERNRR